MPSGASARRRSSRSFAQSRLAVGFPFSRIWRSAIRPRNSLPLYTKKSMAFSRLVKGRPDASGTFSKLWAGPRSKACSSCLRLELRRPGRRSLTKAIEDLVEEREKHDERPLFLWDEVPYMLKSISDREGEPVAMEVFDTLRGLRQGLGDKGLRMILTGFHWIPSCHS